VNAADQPKGVLLVGMHRSGTSATAGALGRLGFHLGDELVPAAEDNPLGYFEHSGVVAIHDELLSQLGRSWDDVRGLPSGWQETAAALDAVAAIEDLVLPGLWRKAPWLVKDPRLSRLLPLWRKLQTSSSVHIAYLLAVRHPDEVAASLLARDGMPAMQARMLWLRHVLEATAASAGSPRAVVDYDRLLVDPLDMLGAAAATIRLPLRTDNVDEEARGFISSGGRHHVARPRRGAEDPWHALALDVHAALQAAAPTWPMLDAFHARMADLERESGALIEAIGAGALSAARRARRLQARALELERCSQALQAEKDRVDAALLAAETLSLQRMEESRQLDSRLAETGRAFAHTERLSLERLEEARALRRQLDETQEAFERAERLTLERQQEAQALRRQLDETQDAFERAERLTLERQQEAEALRRQLDQTQDAFEHAERLSLERHQETQALHGQVGQTQTAFAGVERLALERLQEAQGLRGQLEATQDALAQAERLAVERLDGAQELRRLADQAQEAFERAERLSLERLEEVQALRGQLDRTQEALGHAERLAVERLDAVHPLRQLLDQTQDAFARAERLAIERLEEAQALRQQLDRTSEALNRAERLCAERQQENQALLLKSETAERAVAEAERLALSWEGEYRAVRTELGQIQPAFARLERLSMERLEETHMLRRQLEDAEQSNAAFAEQQRGLEARLSTIERSHVWRLYAACFRLIGRTPTR